MKVVDGTGSCALDGVSWKMNPQSTVKQRVPDNKKLRDYTGDAMERPENKFPFYLAQAMDVFDAIPSDDADDDSQFFDEDLFRELRLLAEPGVISEVANEAQVKCYVNRVRQTDYYFEEISLHFLDKFVLQKLEPPWSIAVVHDAPESEMMKMNPRTVYMSNHPSSTYS